MAMVYAADARPAGRRGTRARRRRAANRCRAGGARVPRRRDGRVGARPVAAPHRLDDQVRALAEGAVIGDYDAGRWRSGERRAASSASCSAAPATSSDPWPSARRSSAAGPTWPASSSTRPRTCISPPASPSGRRRFRGCAARSSTRRGRARRAGRRRSGQRGRAAADRAPARAARRAGRTAAHADREVRDVRQRRLLPQVAGRHRPPEGRHGRRRRGRRRRWARSPSSGSRCR